MRWLKDAASTTASIVVTDLQTLQEILLAALPAHISQMMSIADLIYMTR